MLDSTVFGVIVTGLSMAAVMACIQYITSRLRPRKLASDQGTLHLNDTMIAVGILVVFGVGCAGVFYHMVIAHSFSAILIAFISLVSVPVMATAFSPHYDISWDTKRIIGPGTIKHPPFGHERKEIPIENIVAAGKDNWGNYFVEDIDGTRIRWNWLYSGYPELMNFIEDVCPYLFPDLLDEDKGDMSSPQTTL